MTTGMPTRAEVRQYLSDTPLKNFKYDDQFFTDADIDIALKWALERFYSLPPVDTVNVVKIPSYILLMGTIAQLFKRQALSSAINYNPGISENGINIPEGEDAQIFDAIAQKYDAEFSNAAYAFKQAYNIKQALSSIKSPFNRYKSCRPNQWDWNGDSGS